MVRYLERILKKARGTSTGMPALKSEAMKSMR